MFFFLNSRVRSNRFSRRWFTIIEVLIAIMIFGLWLISAYILSSAAGSLSLRSKQEIIATNLLREQIELFKNIRDTNFLALRNFDSLAGIDPWCAGAACRIGLGYHAIWVGYSAGNPPVFFRKDIFNSSTWVPSNSGNGWASPSGIRAHSDLVAAESRKPMGSTTFRYCLDIQGRYRLDCDSTMKMTPYYGFLLVQPLQTEGVSVSSFEVEGAYRVSAYFATTEWGYREIAMSTIVTDFKK